MRLIANILFPVDFSPSCIAMAAYVKRAATLFGAKVSLVHVFDPSSYNAFELYVRPASELAQEHAGIARDKLNSFLAAEFAPSEHPRILASGDAATAIADVARKNAIDLIIMPTHAGTFRRMLLGSTTAKVLNDVDCPVVTSKHAETIAPRPLEHREWICAIGFDENSERVLRFCHQAAAEARGNLTIIHAIQSNDRKLPVQLDIEEKVQSEETREARERIADLQRKISSQAPVRIAIGPIKDALLETAGRFDADVLIIGRAPQSDPRGRVRDLTYAIVRDSPFPVLSI
jgi:nucleotide-binding universal stress UspA family protein